MGKEYICSKKYKNLEVVDNKTNYTTIKEAFSKIEEGSMLYLLDKYYNEKITLNKKNITLIGNESIIDFSDCHATFLREEDGDTSKTYGTTGSSTFRVLKYATNFTMKNVEIRNSFKRIKGVKGGQAVAFKTESTNGFYKDCKFNSFQDTLYVDNNDNLFIDCFIEGDVDFIFGAGNAVFSNCEITMKHEYTDEIYLSAPDTYETNNYGLSFFDCKIIEIGKGINYIGRGWYPSGAKEPVKPRAYFKDCNFDLDIILELKQMHEKDPSTSLLNYKDIIIKTKKYNNSNLELDDKYKKYYDFLLNKLAK